MKKKNQQQRVKQIKWQVKFIKCQMNNKLVNDNDNDDINKCDVVCLSHKTKIEFQH